MKKDTNLREIDPSNRRRILQYVQEFLSTKGLMRKPSMDELGRTEGILGDITRAAILAYQSDAGLRIDGRITKDLLDSMNIGIDSLIDTNAKRQK